MSPEALLRISELISGHQIFQNSARIQQTSVVVQLLVAVHHFGHLGNAAFAGMIAPRFGIGEGEDMAKGYVEVRASPPAQYVAQYRDLEVFVMQLIKRRAVHRKSTDSVLQLGGTRLSRVGSGR